MVDDEKCGTIWADDELDAIVEDYFVMLNAELSRNAYVKSRHSAALMAKIGRSHRSVEFKHQNISAVLEALGLPWILGYVPKRNYQNAIFAAIDRYLSKHDAVLDLVPTLPMPFALASSVFVSPPVVSVDQQIPSTLQRLIRKFDPVERDHRNRSLGKAGEAFVLHLEQQRLEESERSDLAGKVRWVAEQDGDGAGYDIFSFDPSGSELLIEVKTTNGAARTPFYLSRNEREMSAGHPNDWCIYRVHLFAKDPRAFRISAPLEDAVILKPETWRASF